MLAVLLSLACYKVDYVSGATDPRPADEEYWNHRVVYGIVELEGPLQVDEICEAGDFTRIHTEIDATTALVTWLAGGQIYAPDMIYVWCVDGLAYRAVAQDGVVLSLEAPVDQERPAHLGAAPATECAD